MKKKINVFEIICYVVAAILGIVAFYMLYENIAYMNEYLAAYGMTMADLGSQATQSIIGAFVPYFTYAFLTLAAGLIYRSVAAPKCVCEEAPVEAEEAEEVLELEAPVEALEAPVEAVAEEAAEEAAEEEPAVTVVWAETPASVDATEAAPEEEK